MAQLTPPKIPDGPLQELNAALHDLHHAAGWPSLRTIRNQITPQSDGDQRARPYVASVARIHDVFSSPRLPAWGLLELIVESLATHAPGREAKIETARFHLLWRSAGKPGFDTDIRGIRPVRHSMVDEAFDPVRLLRAACVEIHTDPETFGSGCMLSDEIVLTAAFVTRRPFGGQEQEDQSAMFEVRGVGDQEFRVARLLEMTNLPRVEGHLNPNAASLRVEQPLDRSRALTLTTAHSDTLVGTQVVAGGVTDHGRFEATVMTVTGRRGDYLVASGGITDGVGGGPVISMTSGQLVGILSWRSSNKGQVGQVGIIPVEVIRRLKTSLGIDLG
ncbi:trypsin-like serine protease [Actinoplanes subglobosus]|uniref:Trypsin-like serine protease n=1 Tax=Actinoplanes subglobosus TaxID=1547892 RepID=A0ABV8IUR2_9ACTN